MHGSIRPGKRRKVRIGKRLGVHEPNAAAVPASVAVRLDDGLVVIVVLLGLGQQKNVLVRGWADPSRSLASHWACTRQYRSASTNRPAATRKPAATVSPTDPWALALRVCRGGHPSRGPGSSCRSRATPVAAGISVTDIQPQRPIFLQHSLDFPEHRHQPSEKLFQRRFQADLSFNPVIAQPPVRRRCDHALNTPGWQTPKYLESIALNDTRTV